MRSVKGMHQLVLWVITPGGGAFLVVIALCCCALLLRSVAALCCYALLLHSAAVEYRLEFKKPWERDGKQIGFFLGPGFFWRCDRDDGNWHWDNMIGRMQAERQFRREVLRVFVDVFVDVFSGVLYKVRDPVVELSRKRYISRGLSLEQRFTENPSDFQGET